MYMAKRNLAATIFFMGILFVGTFALSYWIFDTLDPNIAQAPSPEPTDAEPVLWEPEEFSAARQEIYYRGCRHLVTKEIDLSVVYPGKSAEDLKAMGWQVDTSNPEKIILRRDDDGLCPEDDVYRRVAVTEDGIGIFAGPIGTDGPLLQTFTLDISILPAEWQQKLAGDGIEFADEEDMISALDSLEELLDSVGYGE